MSRWEKLERTDSEDLLGSVARARRVALTAALTLAHAPAAGVTVFHKQLLKLKGFREVPPIFFFLNLYCLL